MNIKRHLPQSLCAAAVVAVMAFGVCSLTAQPAHAAPPGPLCGWSALWDCTMPDGSHRIVGGTRCDIAKFEKSTGAHCVLSGL